MWTEEFLVLFLLTYISAGDKFCANIWKIERNLCKLIEDVPAIRAHLFCDVEYVPHFNTTFSTAQ